MGMRRTRIKQKLACNNSALSTIYMCFIVTMGLPATEKVAFEVKTLDRHKKLSNFLIL